MTYIPHVIICSSYTLVSVLEQFVRLSQACCNAPDCGSLECGHMGSNLFEFAVGKHTSGLQGLFVLDIQHLCPPETARTNYGCSAHQQLCKLFITAEKSAWFC